jgi:hypothetical protein
MHKPSRLHCVVLSLPVRRCRWWLCKTLLAALPICRKLCSSPASARRGRLTWGGATKATLVAKNHTTYDAAGCPVWNVQVGYTDVTVYVAREVAGNACARAHVLEHELRHVQVYRSALDTLALRANARMLTQIQQRGSEQLSVEALLGAAMGEVALTVPEHLAIDTEEEVSLNQTACDGAIAHAYRRWRKWRNG